MTRSRPPGSEPALPEEPLKLTQPTFDAIGSDAQPDSEELGRGPSTKRKFYGLYYQENSGKYQFKLVFPVWAERQMPSRTKPNETDRASLFAGLYYNRRSAERADDILFPLVWNLRDKLTQTRTTIVGPLVNRSAPGESDNWLAPLYFTGTRKTGGYTLIPPLLTYTNHDDQGGFNMVGPLFCSWKGGSNCDARTAQDIDFGVAPFYFYGQNVKTKYEIIPPLLHYYRYNDRDLVVDQRVGPVLPPPHPEAGHVPPVPALLQPVGQGRAAHHGAAVLPLRLQGRLLAVRHAAVRGRARRKGREHVRRPGSTRATAAAPSSTWSRPCTGRIAIRTSA